MTSHCSARTARDRSSHALRRQSGSESFVHHFSWLCECSIDRRCAYTVQVEVFAAFLGFHTLFDYRKSLLSQKEAQKFDVNFAAYVTQIIEEKRT